MQHHITADDVPLLWTQAPRFVQIMRGNAYFSGFQHPHYFWYQSDKLTVLLNNLLSDTTSFTQEAYFYQARESLSQLLNESQCFSGLTREQLRQLEPNVRTFIEKVQNVDVLVQEWDMRRQMAIAASQKQVSRKRGRDEEEEENDVPSFGSMKRRRESCSAQWMDVEAAYAAVPFIMDSPWMNQAPPAQQPVMWSESFYA